MKSIGIKTLETIPIPSFTSWFDINQKITHRTIMPMKVGTTIPIGEDKSEFPPTLFVKNEAVSDHQPKLKLLTRYTKSQLKITI